MSDFSDLLVKIAQNKPLTPGELSDLGRFGRETQQRNSFVGGNTTASGALNVQFPKTSGVHLFGQGSLGSSVAGFQIDLGTLVLFDTDSYFRSTNPTRITVPQKGVYGIAVNFSFASTSTTGYREVTLYVGGALDRYFDTRGAAPTYPTYISSYIERSLDVGEYFEIGAYQNSGSTLTVVVEVSVALLNYNTLV